MIRHTTSRIRQWWTQSNEQLLYTAQETLLSKYVEAPYRKNTSCHGMNSIEFYNNPPHHQQQSSSSSSETSSTTTNTNTTTTTVILLHGYGSGLGCYYKNVDLLLQYSHIRRVILVDWYGMGGSHRSYLNRPKYLRRATGSPTTCHHHHHHHNEIQPPLPPMFTDTVLSSSSPVSSSSSNISNTTRAMNFFLQPFHEWIQQSVISTMNDKETIILVGHSLGGYLTCQYMIQYPYQQQYISKLLLASPIGFATTTSSDVVVSDHTSSNNNNNNNNNEIHSSIRSHHSNNNNIMVDHSTTTSTGSSSSKSNLDDDIHHQRQMHQQETILSRYQKYHHHQNHITSSRQEDHSMDQPYNHHHHHHTVVSSTKQSSSSSSCNVSTTLSPVQQQIPSVKVPNILSKTLSNTMIQSIYTFLWKYNITPQQFIRLCGQKHGKYNIMKQIQCKLFVSSSSSSFVSMEQTQHSSYQNGHQNSSLLNDVSTSTTSIQDTDMELLADYIYHITVADPSGEYALNSLLLPTIQPTNAILYGNNVQRLGEQQQQEQTKKRKPMVIADILSSISNTFTDTTKTIDNSSSSLSPMTSKIPFLNHMYHYQYHTDRFLYQHHQNNINNTTTIPTMAQHQRQYNTFTTKTTNRPCMNDTSISKTDEIVRTTTTKNSVVSEPMESSKSTLLGLSPPISKVSSWIEPNMINTNPSILENKNNSINTNMNPTSSSSSNSSLHIYAREPLYDIISNQFDTSYGLESMKILYGHNDWMRYNCSTTTTDSKQSGVPQQGSSTTGNTIMDDDSNNTIIIKNEEYYARQSLEQLHQRTGIETSVHIIPNVGHHLYIENPIDFCYHIVH